MKFSIQITITPLVAIVIAAFAVLWIVVGMDPDYVMHLLFGKATPFLLLLATWIAALAVLRRS